MITATELAAKLMKIHVHAGSFAVYEGEMEDHVTDPDEIVYREADILTLLKELGFPEPDWEGNAKQNQTPVIDMNDPKQPWNLKKE